MGGLKILPVIMCGGSGTRMYGPNRGELAQAYHPPDRPALDLSIDRQRVSDPAVFGPRSSSPILTTASASPSN